MAFSFEIQEWMKPFLENPMLIVMWAAFGMPLFILAFMFVIRWLLAMFHTEFRKKVMNILGATLVFTWLAGFVMTMIMFFSEIHPVKLILCWFSLLITTLVFCVIEQRSVLKWIDSQTEVPLIKKKKKS